MEKDNACRVYTVRDLQNIQDSAKGKWFQVFKAGPYNLVTGPHYVNGQYGVVIPIGAIVPDHIAEEMWVLGKLGGKKRNRVVRKTMAGHVSEGLFYGAIWINGHEQLFSKIWDSRWHEGDDVTAQLGVAFNV